MRQGYFQLRLDEAIALLGYSYSGRAVLSVDAAVWAINDRRSSSNCAYIGDRSPMHFARSRLYNYAMLVGF